MKVPAHPDGGIDVVARTSAWGRPRAAFAVCAGLFVLVCWVLPLPGTAQERAEPFPKRKAGLWEVRGTSAQATGMPPSQHCVGEATDRADHHLDRTAGAKGVCTWGAFRRAGQSWLAESVCKEGKTVVTSRAIASGDLESNYRIDTVVNYDPPLAGIKREDKEAVIARFLGPCAPGQKPGDIVITGMGTLNMVDGTFRSEPPPRVARPPARKPVNPAQKNSATPATKASP